jgi:hypothetical protein
VNAAQRESDFSAVAILQVMANITRSMAGLRL